MQEQAKQWEESIKATYGGPNPPTTPPPGLPVPPAPTGADRTAALEQLAQLKESGVLTEEQFENAKAQLLGGT